MAHVAKILEDAGITEYAIVAKLPGNAMESWITSSNEFLHTVTRHIHRFEG